MNGQALNAKSAMKCQLLLLQCLTVILLLCKSIFIFRELGHRVTLCWLVVHGMQVDNSSSFCQCWIWFRQLGEIQTFKEFWSLKTALTQLGYAYFARFRVRTKPAPSHFSPLLFLSTGSQNRQGTNKLTERTMKTCLCSSPLQWLLIWVLIPALWLTTCVSMGTLLTSLCLCSCFSETEKNTCTSQDIWLIQ